MRGIRSFAMPYFFVCRRQAFDFFDITCCFFRGKPWTMSASLDADPHQRDVEFLDKYAMDRWESVLQFLVQPGRGPKAISRDAMRTLLHAGLIER